MVLIFESMLRKIILSFLYIFFTASLFFALLFWFLQSTLFNNLFYTEQILPQIYPTVLRDIAEYALDQDSFLRQHISPVDMETIVQESFPLQDAKEMTNMLFDRFLQHTFSDTQNAVVGLEMGPFKNHYVAALRAFLVSFVQQLSVCMKPEDATTFTCRMGDTSPEAVETFINSFIDLPSVLQNVPDRIDLTTPKIALSSFLFRMDNLWLFIVFLPLLLLLLIVAVSSQNIKSFFQKQGWLFLMLGIVFFVGSFLLSEYFSFAKFQLEQEMGDSTVYLNLFYGTYSGMVKTELLWTALILCLIAGICFSFFFSLRFPDKKRR